MTATQANDAYGQAAGGTGSSVTPYQYGATSGYRNDGDNGLLHIGARWYDPVIGRWISADPYLGQITAPLSRNRYLYCEAGPVNAVDPSGLASDLFSGPQAPLPKDFRQDPKPPKVPIPRKPGVFEFLKRVFGRVEIESGVKEPEIEA